MIGYAATASMMVTAGATSSSPSLRSARCASLARRRAMSVVPSSSRCSIASAAAGVGVWVTAGSPCPRSRSGWRCAARRPTPAAGWPRAATAWSTRPSRCSGRPARSAAGTAFSSSVSITSFIGYASMNLRLVEHRRLAPAAHPRRSRLELVLRVAQAHGRVERLVRVLAVGADRVVHPAQRHRGVLAGLTVGYGAKPRLGTRSGLASSSRRGRRASSGRTPSARSAGPRRPRAPARSTATGWSGRTWPACSAV